jgi:hypothetical protein
VKNTYFIVLLIISIILFVFVWKINQISTFKYNNPHALWIVLYQLLLGLLMYLSLKKTYKDRPQAFIYRFMGFSGLRLFLHFMLLIVYWFVFKQMLVAFTVQFLILYMIYTIVEVYYLYKEVKQLPKP